MQKLNNMNLKVLLALCLYMISFSSIAQKDKQEAKLNYDKLWNYFIDEKYEMLLMKADAITGNDKRRKEPMPYLFISMAYYEMSKNEDFDEDYPKAFKNALSHAAKYRKKDKNYTYEDDYVEFLQNLRSDAMEVAENLVEEDKFSKAKSFYKYFTKMDPDCESSWLMYGYCLVKLNDVSGAREAMKHVNFDSESDFDGLSTEQARLAKYGLISYAEHLKAAGMRDSAQTTIDLGKEFYLDDKEYKIVHEDIYR